MLRRHVSNPVHTARVELTKIHRGDGWQDDAIRWSRYLWPINSPTRQGAFNVLVEGFDPETNEELKKNETLNKPVVIRALLTAIGALELAVSRERRRAMLPKSVGKTWTADEAVQLIKAYQAGDSVEVLAERHARTVRAIEARLVRLGAMEASSRTTEQGVPMKSFAITAIGILARNPESSSRIAATRPPSSVLSVMTY